MLGCFYDLFSVFKHCGNPTNILLFLSNFQVNKLMETTPSSGFLTRDEMKDKVFKRWNMTSALQDEYLRDGNRSKWENLILKAWDFLRENPQIVEGGNYLLALFKSTYFGKACSVFIAHLTELAAALAKMKVCKLLESACIPI